MWDDRDWEPLKPHRLLKEHEAHTILYCTQHDMYACRDCDVWLSVRCRDLDCPLCKDIPNKPSEVK